MGEKLTREILLKIIVRFSVQVASVRNLMNFSLTSVKYIRWQKEQ